jgi:hypothetical protein
MRYKLAFYFLFLLNLNTFAQQAWTSPKGKYYSQIGFTYLPYDGFVGKNNAIVPLDRNILHNSIQGYFQYGITNKFMGTLVLPITFTNSSLKENTLKTGPPNGKLNGLSNVQIGLTYKLYEKGGFVVSSKLNTSLASARKDTTTGLRTGDDAYAIGPSLLVGLGLKKFFTSFEIGNLYRSNNYSSQIIGGFQIGKFIGKNKRLLSIFHTDLRYSQFNGKYNDGNTKYTITYLNDLNYTSFGLKFGYKINKKLMAWSDLRFAPFASDNVGARTKNPLPGMSFSISYTN